jgi:hypothetical protein
VLLDASPQLQDLLPEFRFGEVRHLQTDHDRRRCAEPSYLLRKCPSITCPYQIFRTCCRRCGCGPETSTVLGQMTPLLVALLVSLRATIRCRLELAAEILALRHQLAVLQRTNRNDRASVRSIGCCGCCSRASGRIGGRRCTS